MYMYVKNLTIITSKKIMIQNEEFYILKTFNTKNYWFVNITDISLKIKEVYSSLLFK